MVYRQDKNHFPFAERLIVERGNQYDLGIAPNDT